MIGSPHRVKGPGAIGSGTFSSIYAAMRGPAVSRPSVFGDSRKRCGNPFSAVYASIIPKPSVSRATASVRPAVYAVTALL